LIISSYQKRHFKLLVLSYRFQQFI
jgi:hypothetical protein